MRYTGVLAKGGAMRIGLVLAGGFAKGAYQLGALQALSEFIPRSEIRYMSTASIGTLNGYAFATDQLEFISVLSSVLETENKIVSEFTSEKDEVPWQ